MDADIYPYVRLIATIVVLIVLILILYRFRREKNPVKSSLAVLKERFERGEITEREYKDAMKQQGYDR